MVGRKHMRLPDGTGAPHRSAGALDRAAASDARVANWPRFSLPGWLAECIIDSEIEAGDTEYPNVVRVELG